MDLRVLDTRQNLKILVMFLITQFLGLLLATQVYASTPLVELQTYQQSAMIGNSVETAVSYIIAVVLFAIVLVLILRKFKGNRFLVLLEAFVIFYTTFILFLIVIGILLNLAGAPYLLGYNQQYILAAVFAAALVFAKNRWPRLRNATAILACVGIGLVIGIYLDFLTVYLFMIILAVYDYVAVFITKHMVAMGKAMAGANLAFLVGTSDVEGVPESTLSREDKKITVQHGKMLTNYKHMLGDLHKKHLAPLIGQRMLGNGDLAMPLMVSVAAYKLYQTFTASIIVAIGAAFGLMLTFYILNKYRRPLPAIPPLLFGITVALAIYLFAMGAI